MKLGTRLAVVLVALVGSVAAQTAPQPFDFDFNISYSGSYISGRLVGLHLDANGNGTEVDPSSVLLFHVPAIVGLPASQSQPYVFVPHTFERSTYFSGTLISTTPGVYGFQVSNYTITPAMQNLLMIDASNDVTLVFNFGASLGPEGGVATYGIQAEEDALWPAVNSFVSFTVALWKDLGFSKPGVAGMPSLAGTGSVAPNASVTLTLSHAKPLASAWLVYGMTPTYLQALGGVVVPDPAMLVPLATNSAGVTVLPVLLPPDFPAGVPFYLQCWIADPAATFGYSASNGMVAIAHP